MSQYRPPKNRLKQPKTGQLKEIHSLLQGYDGDQCECFKCAQLIAVEHAEIHHINGDESDNTIENTATIHGKCNRELNGAKGGKINAERSAALRQRYSIVALPEGRESERQAPTHAARDESSGSAELVKHNSMRPRYDAWVRNTATGPFSNRYSWPRDLLAEAAPYACSTKLGEAFGSSKTYLKYINEDIQGKILNAEMQEGMIVVTLNKDMLKKIQEQTGQ